MQVNQMSGGSSIPDTRIPDARFQESEYFSFLRGVSQNIQELARHVRLQKKIDETFINILQQDLDALDKIEAAYHLQEEAGVPVDGYWWQLLDEVKATLLSLMHTVYTIALQVFQRDKGSLERQLTFLAQEATQTGLTINLSRGGGGFGVLEPKDLPALGSEISPRELPHEDGGILGRALEALEAKDVKVCRVRPDGHCLFRSIVALVFMSPKRFSELKRLLCIVRNDQQLSKNIELAPLERIISLVDQKKRNVKELIRDEKVSTLWVAFFRQFVCNWWNHSQRSSEEIADLVDVIRVDYSGFIGTDAEVRDRYLTQMALMTGSPPQYGGGAELTAIANYFRTEPIKILNLISVGKGLEKIPENIGREAMLLFRDNHYDFTVSK